MCLCVKKKKISFCVPFSTRTCCWCVWTSFSLPSIQLNSHTWPWSQTVEEVWEASKQNQIFFFPFLSWRAVFFQKESKQASKTKERKKLINYIRETIKRVFLFPTRFSPIFVCLQNINKNLWHFPTFFASRFSLSMSRRLLFYFIFFTYKKPSILSKQYFFVSKVNYKIFSGLFFQSVAWKTFFLFLSNG